MKPKARIEMEDECCSIMREQMELCRNSQPNPLDSPDVFLVYVPTLDEYGIPVRDGTRTIRLIQFCPWCGTRLPESKRERWLRELKAIGIEDPLSPDVPEEFKSDEWWRK
jgi:hypothetical protein